MFRIHAHICPQFLFEPPPEQEIGLPAEYHDQQAQQYTRKNSVQAEEPAQQHRHPDIDRRLDHRSPNIAEQTVGVDIGIHRRPRKADIQRRNHQTQRQVVQHVFGAYPKRNEGRREHIDSETYRAAQQEPHREQLFEYRHDTLFIPLGHQISHPGIHAVEHGAHQRADPQNNEHVVSIERHQCQRSIGVNDDRAGLHQGESSDLMKKQL